MFLFSYQFTRCVVNLMWILDIFHIINVIGFQRHSENAKKSTFIGNSFRLHLHILLPRNVTFKYHIIIICKERQNGIGRTFFYSFSCIRIFPITNRQTHHFPTQNTILKYLQTHITNTHIHISLFLIKHIIR